MDKLQIFSGNSNPPLAKAVCQYLGIKPGEASIRQFSDGEIFVEIKENVRGQDVFVVQSTSTPANNHMMELLIMIDALKRASAGQITAVLPYYGYARQDRKVHPRTPITSKLVADVLQAAGADRILTVDLHAGQIQGFFDIPVDHLYAMPVHLDYLRLKFHEHNDIVTVSPDAGGAERARAFAKHLNSTLAMVDKRRPAENVAEVMHIIGSVKDKRAVIVDDMIDTAGTLVESAKALLEAGAKEVYACATHPVFSGPAIERIESSPIEEVVVTDTILLSEKAAKCQKIKTLSTAGLLGEAVRRINNNDSVSSLFV